MKRKLPNRYRLELLYSIRGFSCGQIAKLYGCAHPGVVAARLKYHGIPRRPKSFHKRILCFDCGARAVKFGRCRVHWTNYNREKKLRCRIRKRERLAGVEAKQIIQQRERERRNLYWRERYRLKQLALGKIVKPHKRHTEEVQGV